MKRRTHQCAACPWKKSTRPGQDIPGGYDPEKHRKLISCQTGMEGLGKPIHAMACHESSPGTPYACVGWVVNQLGPGNNIPLRLRAMSGEFAGFKTTGPQHESLEEMVATAGQRSEG